MHSEAVLMEFFNDGKFVVESKEVTMDGEIIGNSVSVEDVKASTRVTFKGVESHHDLKMKCLNALYHQKVYFGNGGRCK